MADNRKKHSGLFEDVGRAIGSTAKTTWEGLFGFSTPELVRARSREDLDRDMRIGPSGQDIDMSTVQSSQPLPGARADSVDIPAGVDPMEFAKRMAALRGGTFTPAQHGVEIAQPGATGVPQAATGQQMPLSDAGERIRALKQQFQTLPTTSTAQRSETKGGVFRGEMTDPNMQAGIQPGGYATSVDPRTGQRYLVGSQDDPNVRAEMRGQQERIANKENFDKLYDSGAVTKAAQDNMADWNKTVAQRKEERAVAQIDKDLQKEMAREGGPDQRRIDEIENRRSQVKYENALAALEKTLFLAPGATSEKNKQLTQYRRELAEMFKQEKQDRMERFKIDAAVKMADERVEAARALGEVAGFAKGFEIEQNAMQDKMKAEGNRQELIKNKITKRFGGQAAETRVNLAFGVLSSMKNLEGELSSPGEMSKIYDWFAGLSDERQMDILSMIGAGEGGTSPTDQWKEIFKEFNTKA